MTVINEYFKLEISFKLVNKENDSQNGIMAIVSPENKKSRNAVIAYEGDMAYHFRTYSTTFVELVGTIWFKEKPSKAEVEGYITRFKEYLSEYISGLKNNMGKEPYIYIIGENGWTPHH